MSVELFTELSSQYSLDLQTSVFECNLTRNDWKFRQRSASGFSIDLANSSICVHSPWVFSKSLRKYLPRMFTYLTAYSVGILVHIPKNYELLSFATHFDGSPFHVYANSLRGRHPHVIHEQIVSLELSGCLRYVAATRIIWNWD